MNDGKAESFAYPGRNLTAKQVAHKLQADLTAAREKIEELREERDKLRKMLGDAEREYRERYCDAFRTWASALREGAQRYPDDESLQRIVKALPEVELAVVKSNLLWRLIYCGCSIRTRQCPTHKGRWVGCQLPGYCECQHGSDVTGWLPNEDEDCAQSHAVMAMVAVPREKP